MRFRERSGVRETKSRARDPMNSGAVGAEEPREQVGAVLGGDSDTGVGDRNRDGDGAGRRVATVIVPPSGVYLTAFERRLSRICRMRRRSIVAGAEGAMSRANAQPAASATGRIVSTASSTRAATSPDSRSSRSSPLITRAAPRRSSIIVETRPAFLPIVPAIASASAGTSGSSPRSSAKGGMGLSRFLRARPSLKPVRVTLEATGLAARPAVVDH